jgi:shikimate dehydrogenase
MDRYVVCGNPVEHSQSPIIHTHFAQATAQQMSYDRLWCPLDGFADAVRRFAAEGGSGCNVTVPFKFEAYGLAPRHSARAALAQAANVLRFDTEGWWADNTDGAGLVRDIEVNASYPLAGRRLLLVGAGGAAAGALGSLIQARPAQVVVANRTPDKASALVERHRLLAQDLHVALACAPLTEPGLGYDVVINASASSLQGDAAPVTAAVLRPGTLALDMMYGPAAHGFLSWAAHHGAQPRDGLGMLVEQAAESCLLWRGIRPDTAPVLASLRRRLTDSAT